MSSKPTSLMKRRLNVFIALCLVLFTGWIIINLCKVSIKDNKRYQSLANSQQFRARTINANRGTIYDSKMQILAQSATVYTVFIDPAALKKNDIKKKDLIVDTLAEILEMDKADVLKYAEKSSSYEIIKRKVEKPVADKVIKFKSDNGISCIGCDPDSKRFYPQNDLASSVIGFTGYEGHGQYGLEAQYDEYLSGIDGKIISAKDALGADMPYKYEQAFAAQNGNSLVLNIDSTLQFYLERELNNCIAEHAPKERACGIIMNAKTGQILAMSTKPDFDLNNPTEITDPAILNVLSTLDKNSEEYKKEQAAAWERQWKNKAITELYFPGSVFKVVTGSAALDTKSISLTDRFNCTGSIDVSGTTFHCWGKAHGSQNFVEATTHSCNPAYVQIGLKLGWDNFVNYFKAYGLDSKTGIDLPGEVSSINMVNQKPSDVTLASSAFGQTNKITPLEMITAYAAVVNGGNLVTPYVVDKIIDSDGNIVEQFEPKIKRQVISEDTSKTMRETLETVCRINGGSNAYIEGYRIGGKSGTSQKMDIEGGNEIHVSSYCGFAPANDPEIIMLVMVDEPTTDGIYYGSMVAAPVVRNVFKDALPYLGYIPEYSDEEYAKMSVIVPDVVGKEYDAAVNTLSSSYQMTNVEKVGSGTKILKQVPAAGEKMPRDGKIYLYTESSQSTTVTVPDVSKLSLAEANQRIVNAGLNIRPTGAAEHAGAVASGQSIAAGTKVERGTVVEVTFYANDETG